MKYLNQVTVLTWIFIGTLLELTNGANILFVFAVSTYSHRITVWPLVEKLADLGHNVTFLQPFKPKHPHPKVREIFPAEVEEFMNSMSTLKENWLNIRLKNGHFGNHRITAQILPFLGVKLCDVFLSSKEMKEWIQKSKVDLVVMDGLFNECGFGLAHKFGAKTAMFGTSTMFTWWYDEFGIPTETSWLPEIHFSFPYPLDYFARTFSTLITLATHFHRSHFYFPELEQVMKSKLNLPEMPPMSEMVKKVSFVLMNSHPSEEFARSLPPLVIPIGGMHCDNLAGKKTKTEIPKEISKFMDEAGDQGFIYVSFGSEANIREAPKEFQQRFYTAFGNSKIRFVWKWEGSRPTEMPKNVITAQWLPQQEILAHRNIKAFISHGGLLSIQEAITFEVPMVVFPIFAEQDYNSFRIARTGRGIHLDVQTFTAVDLESAIVGILKNSSYKDNMRKTAKLFKDRPQTPLETAVWWTEYVLRHDTSHLMPLAANQTWYQRRLLDVWGGIALIIISTVIALFYTLKVIFYLISSLVGKESEPIKSKSKTRSASSKVKKS